MFLKRCLIFLFFLLFLFPGFSQETVVPAFDNPSLYNDIKPSGKRLKVLKIQDTLSLPFFDDFSGSLSPYPNSGLWTDSFVFINNSRAVNPLSLGVATFDAIDQRGKIYHHASDVPFYADALTSKPINLSYPVGSNAYLSFFYQPQGLGDTAEIQDSLMVDFFNPVSRRWWNVWRVQGSGLHPFKAVILPVNADSFLVRGFQFRFRNKASIRKNNTDPGKMGDVDHWNIDYIKLDINRSAKDTVIRDVAFTKPVGSLIKTYQSMPWKQFQMAFQQIMRKDIDIYYRNNDTIAHKPDRYFEISDLKGSGKTSFYSGNENIFPQQVYHFTTNLEYPFFTDETDSARFEVKSFLRTESYDIKINDTARFIQVFSNYFAYDDGTPEYGYGLSGQGTSNGMVAYRFTSYFPDSLAAVQIFFNSTLNNASALYSFQLTVWAAATSGPGKVIYQSAPMFPSDLGKYTTYRLDSAILVNGDFYVGWKQPHEDFLNIGLDRNNAAPDRLYYNLGVWQKSAYGNASLMMRPVFGSKGVVSQTKDVIQGEYKIFPNPTSGILNIRRPGDNTVKLCATLLSTTGQVVLQTDIVSDFLDLTNYPAGIYFIVLTENGKAVYKSKVIVQH